LYENGGLSVLSAIGETENLGGWGDGSHVVFGQKLPGEKGSLRKCIVVKQHPDLLSPKFGAKSSRTFMQ
jgi:hypothetical protein